MRAEIDTRQRRRRRNRLLVEFRQRRVWGSVVDLVRGCSHKRLVESVDFNTPGIRRRCRELERRGSRAPRPLLPLEQLFAEWQRGKRLRDSEERVGLCLQSSTELDGHLFATMEEMLKICDIRDLSGRDTREFLRELVDRDVKPWLIDKVKRKILGYRRRRITSRKLPLRSSKQGQVELLACYHVLAQHEQRAELLWLDETGFGTRYLQQYCYERPGESARRVEKLLGHCHTMTCCISSRRVEHYEVGVDRVSGELFRAFMDNLGMHVRLRRRRKAILLMDNLTSHKTTEMMTYYRKMRWNVVFLPVACPELNAIEFLFGLIKRRLVHQPRSNTEEYLRSLRRVIRALEPEVFQNLQRHVLATMERTFVQRCHDLNLLA